MSSIFVRLVFFAVMVFIIVLSTTFHFHIGSYSSNKYLHYNKNNSVVEATHRNLLTQGEAYACNCTRKELSISQSKGSTSYGGIPQYMVQIVNACASHSSLISNIHLHCGWFASARIVNPRIFKRLAYDDCLVKGGHTLTNGEVVTFSYYNTFKYPIYLKHATFC